MKKALLEFNGKKIIVEVPEYIFLMYEATNAFVDNLEENDTLFDRTYEYVSDYLSTIAKVEFQNNLLDVDAYIVPKRKDIHIHCELIELDRELDREFQDEIQEDLDNEKEYNEEQNKIIGKFMGYYQPKDLNKDKMFSYEVFANKLNALKECPESEILKFYGNDIEDFTIIDIPDYDEDFTELFSILIIAINKKAILMNDIDFDLLQNYIVHKDNVRLKQMIVENLIKNGVVTSYCPPVKPKL